MSNHSFKFERGHKNECATCIKATKIIMGYGHNSLTKKYKVNYTNAN